MVPGLLLRTVRGLIGCVGAAVRVGCTASWCWLPVRSATPGRAALSGEKKALHGSRHVAPADHDLLLLMDDRRGTLCGVLLVASCAPQGKGRSVISRENA